jgi:hypothetical protein
LAYEHLRGDRDAAARFFSQSGRAFAKSGAARAQSFLQYDAMLGFGASAVLGRPPFQRFNDILGNVSDQKLRHL